jgi:hypothetical protein
MPKYSSYPQVATIQLTDKVLFTENATGKMKLVNFSGIQSQLGAGTIDATAIGTSLVAMRLY